MSKEKLTGSNQRIKPRYNREHTVYTLMIELDSGRKKIYVGRSKKFDKRLKAHKRGSTTISHLSESGKYQESYSVMDVLSTKTFDTLEEAQIAERNRMVELAAAYGVTNVAGGI